MKKAISTNLHIPLPSAPAPPKIEPHIDEPSSSCSTALTSPITLANLQGICVYQLPFPGVLSEKDQRDKLSAIIKKYTRNFEIRFDAVPNNSQDTTQQTGNRRFQPLPLIRRALIVIQKLANCSTLQNELNRLSMVGCQLKASAATTEDLTAFISARTSKPSPLLASKPAAAPPLLQPNSTDFQNKKPQNLLRLPIISPPAAAVKALIFDSQNHGVPDPFSKNASRTLYIKHLDTNINEEELKTRYSKFGHILDIEVKNRNTMAPYAFIQFTNIESVCSAIKQSNQQQLEDTRQKKNSTHHWWGNTLVSNRLWVGLLPTNCGEQYLASKVRVVLTSPEHDITKVDYDPAFNEAVLIFTGHEAAHLVFNKIKTGQIKFQPESSTGSTNNFVHVDFCSEKLHSYFVDRLFHKSIDVNDPGIISAILPSPPEQPKLLALHSLKKASPSPPPDPSSTENVEKELPISVNLLSTENLEQRIDQSSISMENVGNKQIKVDRNEEKQTRKSSKNKLPNETLKKRSINKQSEIRPVHSSRRSRSSSTSSESSIDTYSMSTKRKYHSQQKLSKEIPPSGRDYSSNSNIHRHRRKKQWQNQPKEEIKYSKGHKHQQQNIEIGKKRIDQSSRDKEGRRLKKHEPSNRKHINDERICRDRTTKKVEIVKKSSGTRGGGDYRKRRSKSDARHQQSSSSSILPPPPQPPTQMMGRIDVAKQPKERDKSTSSCSSISSNSSCSSSYSGTESCSTCIFNEDLPRKKEDEESSESDESSTTMSEYSNENEGKKATLHLETISVSENEEKMPETTPNVVAKISVESMKMEEQIEPEGKEEIKLEPQMMEKAETKMERTDSISSELAHKKSDQPNILPTTSTAERTIRPKCDNLTARLRTLLRSSHVNIPLTNSSSETAAILCDPRKQQKKVEKKEISLEIPRFALKLKLPKHSGNNHQNEQKLSNELKQPKKEESCEDPAIMLGTPISATPSSYLVQRQEIMHHLETTKQPIKEMNEGNSTEKPQPKHPSISSFAKADFALKEIFQKIEERKANLELEKNPMKNEPTNISKIQQELGQILAVFSGTSINELPILVDRYTSSHRQQQSENKMDLDEISQDDLQLHRPPRPIGSSFSLERSDKQNNEEKNNNESYERRNTLPSNSTEIEASTSSLSVAKPRPLIPRPRASSSSIQDIRQSNEFGSPKVESPIASQKSIGNGLSAKTKAEKEEPNQSKQLTTTMKKNPSTILKKQITMNPVEQPNPSMKIAQHQQKLVEQKKSASFHPSPLMHANTKPPLIHKNMEKDLIKKEHKDKEMKQKQSMEIKPLTSNSKKMSSTKEEKQHKEMEQPPKKAFSVGSKEQMKSAILAQQQKCEDELFHHSDEKHQQKRKKKRKHETSSSEEEEEDDEKIAAGLFDIELEEQKKIWEDIKSGKTDGLSMYDRVKRRSSQRPPEEEKKKATVLEQLREKQAKKKKELNRVRLLSTSSDSDGGGSKESAALTATSAIAHSINIQRPAKHATDHSELDEDIEVDVDDSFSCTSSMPKTADEASSINVEPPQQSSSICTIRRPEIAPKKPMPTEETNSREEEDGNEDSEAKNFSSSGEWNLSVSSDGDEIEGGQSKIGDKLVKKLKMEFDRHRPSSQSSIEGGKHDFEQKLARVVEIAQEGLDGQQKANHFAVTSDEDEEEQSASEKSNSSSSSDEEGKRTSRKGSQIFKKQIQKKPVTNLSLEDVFGEDSDEYESTMEENTAERKEALAKSQNIQPTKKDEKKIIPPLKTKKHSKLAETTEEKQNIIKNKKFNEQLRQKSGSVGGKESGKHLLNSKKLKCQSPIRSISIDDLHGKQQQNKEKLKQKRIEKGQIIKKSKLEELKESHKGKRQLEAEIGVCQKRSKLDIQKPTTSKSSAEKEQKLKQMKSPKAAIHSKHEKGLKEDVKTAERNKTESPMKDLKGDGGEMDTIGLLKIVNPVVAADEFEVIDSGKVECNTEKVDEKMEIVDENVKKEEERKREEEQAELLRKMEQNEEEEAVAALKLQTNITIRNSQDTEESQSNLSSFIKPIDHHNWLKKNEIEEPKITESENNDEERMDENKSMESEKNNKNILHESIERRPSNESLDAQMVGSGFVEIDAEVLKEQQEKEILAEEKRKKEEDEHRKAEEVKRLEATVDFVASSKAEIPQIQQQMFAPIQTEFVVKTQTNQQENAINPTIIERKEPSKIQFILESSLQQQQIKPERMGVIVSEPQKLQQQPTATIPEMRIGGTNPPPPQSANIFANLQSEQQKTANIQQHPMNPTISDAQMGAKMSSYEAAYSIPTTTLLPSNPPFIQSNFEPQQPSKLFIPPQLGSNVEDSQINQQQKLNAQQQQKEVEKKLSQQIRQQNWQNQQTQQSQQHQLMQPYPSNPTVQAQYQPKDIQQQQMSQQIRKEPTQIVVQIPPQQKQQDLKDSTHSAFATQEQPKQRKQSSAAVLHQAPQQQQHPTQIQHLQQHQQAQRADQFASATAAAAAAGLIDRSQIMQFYQTLMMSGGDQQSQMLQQNQQMQNLSTAAMMAPNALAKWHALFPTPTTSATQNAASLNCNIEDLIRQSALLSGHSSMGMGMPIAPTSLSHQQSGGMQMTPSSIEELYMQQYMAQNASPHLQQQQQGTIPLANNPQQQMEQLQRHTPSQHQQPMQRTQIPPIVCSNPAPQNIPQQPQNIATQYQKPQIIEQQQQKIQKQNVQAAATLWQGQLAMKNSDTLVQMHKVCGNEQLIGRMNSELVSLNEQGIPLLRITQRMRLEQSQLESVVRKMEVEENYLSLICFPCGRDRNDVTVQMEKMKKAFIEYFLQKAAAGIASSPPNSCIAHIFAPDQFIKSLLAKNAPDILRKVELCNAGYLFVILTNS